MKPGGGLWYVRLYIKCYSNSQIGTSDSERGKSSVKSQRDASTKALAQLLGPTMTSAETVALENRKLDLEQQRLDLERQRLDLQKEELTAMREERQRSAALMQEMFKEFLAKKQ